MSPCLSTIMATWSIIPCLSVQGKLIPYTHIPQAIVHVTLTTQTRVLDIIRDGREGTRNPTPVPVLETVKVWAILLVFQVCMLTKLLIKQALGLCKVKFNI